MANELTTVHGAYTEIIASGTISSGGLSARSTSVAGALSATEEIYSTLDFKLQAETTHVADETVDLYRRPSDGTNDAAAPTASYLHQYVGSFTLNGTASTYYYLYGVANVDPEDTFYLVSNCAGSEDFSLDIRGRTFAPAAA